jgi:hypothetical protein
MRFEQATHGAKQILWTPSALTSPAVAAQTNHGYGASVVCVALTSPAVAAQTNSPSITSTIPVTNVVPSPPANEHASAPVPSPPENLSTNSAVQSQTAKNLLVVSPEMLVDYFKPNNSATNAANVHVLVPVNFTPPVSASIPSSQAIYISP